MRGKQVKKNQTARDIDIVAITEPGFSTIQLRSNNRMQPDAAKLRR